MSTSEGSQGASRNPAQDIKLAVVKAEVVHNVFTLALRKLETEIWPVSRTPSRMEILSFVDSLRYQIYKYAAASAPEPAAKKPATKESQPDSRAEFYARRGVRAPA